MKIAFIGLGNMGGGMAANLVKAGHSVNAFDLAEAALARAKENGCATFTAVREAVVGVDAVVSMLPNGKIVDSVYGADVIGHAPASALLLDCSTIDVDSDEHLRRQYGDRVPVVLLDDREILCGKVTGGELREAIKKARWRNPISRILSRVKLALTRG